jgi:hypothetical protein
MKTIENVTIYKCDFCKKELKRKHAMENHEENCLSNPKNNRACLNGCIYLERVEKEVPFEYYYHPDYGSENSMKKVSVFRCSKFDKLMYPFSIERKKDMLEKYPETFEEQEAMPKECNQFSDLCSILG